MEPTTNHLNNAALPNNSSRPQVSARPLPPLPLGVAPAILQLSSSQPLPPVRPLNGPPTLPLTTLRPARPNVPIPQGDPLITHLQSSSADLEVPLTSGDSEGDVDGIAGTVKGVCNLVIESFCFGVQKIVGTAEAAILGEVGHPWKQKRYAFALEELKLGFEALLPSQLKDFKELEETSLLKEVKAVLHSLSIPGTDEREKYYSILNALRQALWSEDYAAELQKKLDGSHYDPAVDLLLLLCKARYAEVHVYAFCKQVMLKVLEEGFRDLAAQSNVSTAQALNAEPMAINIGTKLQPKDFQAIENTAPEFEATLAKNFSMLRGVTNISFDPAMLQNIPFVIGDLQLKSLNGVELKTVRLLRMGCPTIEEFSTKPAYINPEFRAYIQAIACEGKKHLYISFQNEDRTIWLGSEVGRNQAIKDLHNDFPENFEAIVMDQDSAFYKQEGAIYGVESVPKETFINQFYEQLLLDGTGFYFPQKWRQDAEFINGLGTICDVTFSILNVAEDTLSIQERKDFIEIYYALLFIFALRYSNADFANGTCKDAIDRAMKTFSLAMQIILTCQNKEEDPNYQQMHRVFTHAPAFMTKKQPIVHARRERLVAAFARLDTENSKRAIKELTSIIGVDADSALKVIHRENQNF